MKKRSFPFVVLFAVVCSLFMLGCETGNQSPVEHTDPAFLVGKWSLGDKSFTINGDLTFVCNVTVPVVNLPAQVSGKLDATADNLGEHDYILSNMTAGNPDDAVFGEGNKMLEPQLGAFNNIAVTLKPNSDKNEFTFSTSNIAAGTFFGGTYTKQTD